MSLTLKGEVRSITDKKAGDVKFRQYQVLTSDQDKERLLEVDDFDLSRKVEIKKEIELNVYVTTYSAKNGVNYLQYHAIKSGAQAERQEHKVRV